MTAEEKTIPQSVVEDVPEESTTNANATSDSASASAGQDASVSMGAAAAAAQGMNQAQYQKHQSAAERKARKAMQKKGLEQVSGINNVTVMRKGSGAFSFYSPDVYKNASSDTWIVFGEARMENMGNMRNPAAARRAAQAAQAAAASKGAPVAPPAGVTSEATATTDAAPAAEEGGEAVDEAGVEGKDIELVMSQANCSRSMAVKALKSNSNDVVNAIMELTS